MICSYPRSSNSKVFPELYRAGEIELELVPQGTLAERIRAGGAGIPAFYTPTSVGTPLAEGKEQREFDGRDYVLEHGLRADFALIKAEVADRHGNLLFNKTARNFARSWHGRPLHHRAGAPRRGPGRDRPGVRRDAGHLRRPGRRSARPRARVGPDRKGGATHEPVLPSECRLDPRRDGRSAPRRTSRTTPTSISASASPSSSRATCPRGASSSTTPRTACSAWGPAGARRRDPELINAGKKRVTALPGAAYFHHADSFAMIRGGHLDLCVLGALQVAQNGDLANWSTGAARRDPRRRRRDGPRRGRQDDLRDHAARTKEGEPKLVERCSYPLTAVGVVDPASTPTWQ
jgi:hypothetical protein